MRCALGAVLLVCAGSSAARAGVVETASERLVRTDANASGLQDGVYDVYGPSIYGAFSSDVVSYQGGSDGADGYGYAYQDTVIGAGHYTGIVEAIAAASPDAFGFDVSDGYALSRLTVNFVVTGTAEFSLSGSGGGFGSINGAWTTTSYVALESITGGTPTQVFLNEDDDYPSFSGGGTLLAGEYRFVVESEVGVQFLFETGSYIDGNASVTFDMVVTPAPSTMGLFGLAGAGLLRRRRH